MGKTYPNYNREYYLKHRDEILLHNKKYSIINRDKIKIIRKNYRDKNFDSLSEKAKNYRNKIKNNIFEKLGKKCVRCGFDDIRALQIDHINGGGVSEKRQVGGDYLIFILKQLVKGQKKYQILCANCNWIKRSENNEVHKRKI